MIPRIKNVLPMADYRMRVSFDDGAEVIYDAGEDISAIPSFSELKTLPGLFENMHLDSSRTCIVWNDAIDLPSDTILNTGSR